MVVIQSAKKSLNPHFLFVFSPNKIRSKIKGNNTNAVILDNWAKIKENNKKKNILKN